MEINLKGHPTLTHCSLSYQANNLIELNCN